MLENKQGNKDMSMQGQRPLSTNRGTAETAGEGEGEEDTSRKQMTVSPGVLCPALGDDSTGLFKLA